MPPFRVHWSLLDAETAAGRVPPGCALLAVWPAPVNPDECFRDAGFTDFGDTDDAWDAEAAALLSRVMAELSAHGPPSLASPPLHARRGWMDRLRGRPATPLPLGEQVLAPMHWDSLPDAIVHFGSASAVLRTGNGHFLLWITLPAADVDDFRSRALPRIAAGHPLARTDLRWEHLLPADSPR